MDVQTILIAVISSGVVGSLLLFVQFLIQRHDSRQDKNKEVLQAIKRLDEKIIVLDQKIDSVDAKSDERNAVSMRVRILHFADEMMEGRRHSKDAWDQCMGDITDYEYYCNEINPHFRNNQTAATANYIKKEYAQRLEKHDFQ